MNIYELLYFAVYQVVAVMIILTASFMWQGKLDNGGQGISTVFGAANSFILGFVVYVVVLAIIGLLNFFSAINVANSWMTYVCTALISSVFSGLGLRFDLMGLYGEKD